MGDRSVGGPRTTTFGTRTSHWTTLRGDGTDETNRDAIVPLHLYPGTTVQTIPPTGGFEGLISPPPRYLLGPRIHGDTPS